MERESLLSIGKDDGWKGRELLLLSQRPSGLLEPNKCGRKKSKLAARGVAFLQKLQQLRVSGTFVLGFTEARGEEEEERL